MAARRMKPSSGARSKPRRKGLDGYLDDLAPFAPLPAVDHLVAVLDWYARVRPWEDGFTDPGKISRRQSTAMGALLSHSLTVDSDDRIRRDAEEIFLHSRALAARFDTDLAGRLLRRLAQLEELEARACTELGALTEGEQRWAEARDAYARAWERSRASDVWDADLGCKLAWAQIKCGELDQAEKLLESLTERCPESTSAKELLRIARSPSARVQ